ncbi:MAG: hypothetical protein RL563_2239 [Pseudomonadota bacterium]|jgi:hypothetical protein
MTDLTLSAIEQPPEADGLFSGDNYVEPLDPVALIEKAIESAGDDVGAVFEPEVIEAFAFLKANDLANYMRLRHNVKGANKGCLLTALDKAVDQQSSGDDEPQSALNEMVSIARDLCEFVHDADRHAIAIIPYDDHREVWRVDSSGYEEWLRAAYWRAKHIGVTDTVIKSALATLTAAAVNDGEEIEVHIRAAEGDAGYYIDLCDASWRAVSVTTSGWCILERSPVYFIRNQSMRPLPEPMRGGDVGMLWQHTNIPATSRLLVLAWLLECFRPNTPFPVIELVGEQGSAKSTTQSVLRSLVDPNKVMLRGRPKTVEDVFVAAANNWLVSYENLSSLTAEQQDAFCTLATGGGFASRQLHTNGEEHVMETKRPVVLNGIAVVATRPDLIDRVIHVDMPTIASHARRDNADTADSWHRDCAQVFGAMLDIFSAALRILPTVKLTNKQRMADYERFGEAVARALGFEPGVFQLQYGECVRAGIDRALEGNTVAQVLDKCIQGRLLPWNWQGTASQLYDYLTSHSYAEGCDRTTWPRSAKGLTDQLRRIAPAFRAKGVEIIHLGHSRKGAMWRITATDSTATPSGIEGGNLPRRTV